MTTTDRTAALAHAREEFRNALLDGLLVPMGIDGLYGRSGAYERIVDGIEHAIAVTGAAAHGDQPRVLRFPPIFPQSTYDRTDYIKSFPQLTGAISTFVGGQPEHQALIADVDAGADWHSHLSPAGTMLVSAACHPSYATLPAVLPVSGHLMNVYGYCFRHEPAIDPARMQAFRMHEYVFVGTPEGARAHRDAWIDHGLSTLTALGLTATPVAANDPFFGRGGRMLIANQLKENLKVELAVRLYDDLDDGTAVFSANLHEDHFGVTFGLTTTDGGVVHSACGAYGVDRIALALLRTHGFDTASWPASVRDTLGW